MTHPLQQVFDQAILQATKGKGERHGGEATPFMEQPWVHYAKMHGRGFLTGQAAKKLEEAASTRQGEAFVQEALGAIVYLSMAILQEQSLVEKKPARVRVPPELQFEPTKLACPYLYSPGPNPAIVRCKLPSQHSGPHGWHDFSIESGDGT